MDKKKINTIFQLDGILIKDLFGDLRMHELFQKVLNSPPMACAYH